MMESSPSAWEMTSWPRSWLLTKNWKMRMKSWRIFQIISCDFTDSSWPHFNKDDTEQRNRRIVATKQVRRKSQNDPKMKSEIETLKVFYSSPMLAFPMIAESSENLGWCNRHSVRVFYRSFGAVHFHPWRPNKKSLINLTAKVQQKVANIHLKEKWQTLAAVFETPPHNIFYKLMNFCRNARAQYQPAELSCIDTRKETKRIHQQHGIFIMESISSVGEIWWRMELEIASTNASIRSNIAWLCRRRLKNAFDCFFRLRIFIFIYQMSILFIKYMSLQLSINQSRVEMWN